MIGCWELGKKGFGKKISILIINAEPKNKIFTNKIQGKFMIAWKPYQKEIS
jgi:hypothetical protein